MENTSTTNTHPAYQPPTDMLVEITNRCNHRCIFCANRKMTRPRGDIDATLLKRLLGEAYEMGLRRVGLYATGEMFLCRDAALHVANAKAIGYEYVYTDTNGVLATEANLREIIAAGIDSIKFAINAAKRETYAQIHGSDDFDRVIEHLKICHALKMEMNPALKMMVSTVVTKQTEGEIELLRELVSPYIDVFMPYSVRHYFQQYDDDLSALKSDLYGAFSVKLPCPVAMRRINITYNGCLSACCADFNHDLLLADLNDMSLQDAWLCEAAVNFRKRHMAKDLSGTMCEGCHEGRYIEYQPLEI